MSDNLDWDDRDLDPLLGTGSPTPSRPELRQALLLDTLRLLRRRRRLRRLGLVAALAGCYLAGLGTVWLWPPGPVPSTMPASNSPAAVATRPRPEPAPPAVVLERLGETASAEQQAVLYRQAGDRYLEETTDPQAALRCYVQALNAGSAKDATIAPDHDNWLLMALKAARQKEKRDAKALD